MGLFRRPQQQIYVGEGATGMSMVSVLVGMDHGLPPGFDSGLRDGERRPCVGQLPCGNDIEELSLEIMATGRNHRRFAARAFGSSVYSSRTAG